LKKTLHKNRAACVAQGEGYEFKPQYCKKKTLCGKANFRELVTRGRRLRIEKDGERDPHTHTPEWEWLSQILISSINLVGF
jgi:hypothetical protein